MTDGRVTLYAINVSQVNKQIDFVFSATEPINNAVMDLYISVNAQFTVGTPDPNLDHVYQFTVPNLNISAGTGTYTYIVSYFPNIAKFQTYFLHRYYQIRLNGEIETTNYLPVINFTT